MRAIHIEQHGAIDGLKISEIPRPSLKPGEVLVRIEASGINPSDVASVQGRFPDAVLPRVVGRDFAGTVVEGPADLIGIGVWGTGGDLGISCDGTHAEYVAIPHQAASRRPRNLTAMQAAIAGVPFVTAFSALVRLGQIKEGEWVIISGAAGAVGQAAIQLARAKGAHIIALVRNSTEQGNDRFAGIEAIAESDSGNLGDVVHKATNGKGADLALNGVGGNIFGAVLAALAVGGRQVVYSAAGGRDYNLDILSFYRNQTILYGLDTQKLDVTHCAAILNEIAPLFDSGVLRPPAVGEEYPLDKAVVAYGRVASGKGGKIVFVFP
jgi:NADPH:quinone reductase-like Zn-dependent oxidoreductase